MSRVLNFRCPDDLVQRLEALLQAPKKPRPAATLSIGAMRQAISDAVIAKGLGADVDPALASRIFELSQAACDVVRSKGRSRDRGAYTMTDAIVAALAVGLDTMESGQVTVPQVVAPLERAVLSTVGEVLELVGQRPEHRICYNYLFK